MLNKWAIIVENIQFVLICALKRKNGSQMNLIDALDKIVVDHLRFDGRSSMQDLSELTGLSRSAVLRVKSWNLKGNSRVHG